jgi:hypothetical protein
MTAKKDPEPVRPDVPISIWSDFPSDELPPPPVFMDGHAENIIPPVPVKSADKKEH